MRQSSSPRFIPGAKNIVVLDPETAPTVMAGLGPAIHGSAAETKERRGWPAQGRP
jgi:hypothetical protein